MENDDNLLRFVDVRCGMSCRVSREGSSDDESVVDGRDGARGRGLLSTRRLGER